MSDKKDNVVSILTKQDHIAGPLHCTNCEHDWEGIFPTGEHSFECPRCKTWRGIGAAQVIPEVYLQCKCGSIYYTLAEDGPMCIRCGVQEDPRVIW